MDEDEKDEMMKRIDAQLVDQLLDWKRRARSREVATRRRASTNVEGVDGLDI